MSGTLGVSCVESEAEGDTEANESIVEAIYLKQNQNVNGYLRI